MIDKIADGAAAALADLKDGATVMTGGFGTAGLPDALVAHLLDAGARELVVVNNDAGNGGTVADLGPRGAVVVDTVPGLDFDRLQARTAIALARA